MDVQTSPMGASTQNKLAPKLEVPSRAVSIVEHPCIIKNVDKGIVSLGGEVKLSKALRSKLDVDGDPGDGPQDPNIKLPQFISVSLRPDDPYAKKLLATPLNTNNLLLKVTVPKRTGRKRKRGSSGPFLSEHEIEVESNGDAQYTASTSSSNPYVNASVVFRSLQDNASKYKVVPAGVIDESHRFRTLPDIQYAASRDPTMIDIQENLIPLRYEDLKNYKFKTTAGADLTKNIPITPEFLQVPVHYNYKFQQNPFIKYTGDGREVVNTQRRVGTDGYHFVKCDAEFIPMGPKPHTPPEHTMSAYVRDVIASVRAELVRRPVITRHILYNKIGWDKLGRIREAAVYCGYFFESGPFREALVAFGVDPRKDPAFRKYQTINFLSFQKIGTKRSRHVFDKHIRELATKSTEELKTEHIFDGVKVSHTGNLYQFCDISDPLIRRILDTKDIRATCAPTLQGWYHIGTWAKATVILKDKMNRIIRGEVPDESIYERVLSWPDQFDEQDVYATYRSEMYNKEVHKEKREEHEIMNSVRYAAKNPRYAFEKMEARQERVRAQSEGIQNEDADGEDDLDEADVNEDLTEAPDGADAIMDEAAAGSGGDGDEDDEGTTDDENEEQDDEDMDGTEQGVDEVEIGDDADGIFEEDSENDDVPETGQGQQPRPFGGLFKHRLH